MIRSQAIRIPPEETGVARTALSTTAAELHQRYLDDVFRYVARRVRRREEAEDITADVFVAAFAAFPRFRGQCPEKLWLLGIARRKVVDLLRRRKARPELLESELDDPVDPLIRTFCAGDGPEAAVQRAETRRMVRELMAGLKEEQREALLLQYVKELTIAEIATVMGRSPAAVNSLLQRGRAALLQRGKALFLGEEDER